MPDAPETGDRPPEEPPAGDPGSEAAGAGSEGWPEDPDAWERRGRGLSPEDALRRLEERLDRASEAAERLMAEAAAQAASGGTRPQAPSASPKPPPAGWQARDDGGPASLREFEPLLQLVQALRDLIPPELQRRLAAAIRELLLALRALIDWYLDRFEQRHKEPVDVQDIPIL
jgi:hypothetical protein